MFSNRRPGFSLLELLVAVALIGILTGLLLSAVQNVRAAAARMKCANNLRQVSLAAHLSHETDGAFPSSLRGSPGETYPRLGWLPRLLPYLEQQAAWEDVGTDYAKSTNAVFADPPHRNRDRVFTMVGCPADSRTATAWKLSVTHRGITVSLASYLGNHGTDARDRDGVIYFNSRTQLVHITDGTSNTLLAGERPPSPDLVYGWFYAGSGLGGTGALDFSLGARERNPSQSQYRVCGNGPFRYTAGRVTDPCSAFHFWSLHSGGANFAFADGSVRFLAYSADSVLPALATRAGGEVVAVPD